MVLLCGEYLQAEPIKLCLLTSKTYSQYYQYTHIPAPLLAATGGTLTNSCFSNSATVALLAVSLCVIIQWAVTFSLIMLPTHRIAIFGWNPWYSPNVWHTNIVRRNSITVCTRHWICKRGLVHESNFLILTIRNSACVWVTALKFRSSTFVSFNICEREFQFNSLLTNEVMILQSCKIECVYKKDPFHKSSHRHNVLLHVHNMELTHFLYILYIQWLWG